ncbi:MAG: EAL domain-containing protein [Thermoanaerobaculia bacterium]|nr:EAL domain-containing protein [Thermoanaerobaculia bacterium]
MSRLASEGSEPRSSGSPSTTRRALTALSEAVIVVDHEEVVDFVNPAAERLLGQSRRTLVGLPLAQVVQVTDHVMESSAPLDLAPCLRDGLRMSLDDRLVLRRSDEVAVDIEGTVSPLRLEPPCDVVAGAVVMLRDVSDRRVASRRLDRAARFDQLTGLLNRKGFERYVSESLATAKKDTDSAEGSAEGPLDVLFYLDLDLFQVVNDTCGHAAGDMLMQWAASLIRERLGDDDVLARLGGDEFGLLAKGTSMASAERLSDELHQTLRRFRFVWQDKSFIVGVSAGMVPVSGEFDSAADLLGAADKACYLAKRKGRGRTQIYRKDSDEVLRHRGQMSWIVKLQSALDENLFELHWQRILPLESSRSERPLFFETLIRMRDRDRDTLARPTEFLEVAERFGLMPAIDRWVVRHTLRNLAGQPRALIDKIESVSINLSGATLEDSGLLAFLRREIERLEGSGVEASRVCFEITETAAVSNLRRVSEMMHELRCLGCRWALDDFGSGMSSYSYLRELPVDYVKVDGEIVSEILDSPLSWTILQSINEIAHVIDARTIAEHVESPAILWELKRLGVDYGQGFHIARPERLRAVEELSDYPDIKVVPMLPVAVDS